MYFVKFDNIAVFVKERGKLVSSAWNLSHEIYQIEDDFKKMCRRSPFANSKRIDYFDPNKLLNSDKLGIAPSNTELIITYRYFHSTTILCIFTIKESIILKINN